MTTAQSKTGTMPDACNRCRSDEYGNKTHYVDVKTRHGVERLCHGCANSVIRDGIGYLYPSRGMVATAREDEWARRTRAQHL